MPSIAIFNQKGGVGKTTTTLNLAGAAARSGHIPLAIDLDPQAHLTSLAGIGNVDSANSIYSFYRDNRPLAELIQPSTHRWSLIPAHLELAKVDTQFGKGPNILNRLRLALQREQLAAKQRPLFIDCCPLLGVLSLSAIFAADHVLVVVSADYLALKSALQVEKTLNALSPVLKQRIARRYVLTRFDARRKMSWDIDRTLRERFGDELCQTRIGESVALAESPSQDRDVFEHAPNSRGALDYQALFEELQGARFIPAGQTPPKDEQAEQFIADTLRQVAAIR